MPTISLVFPIFNEEAVIPTLLSRLDTVVADLSAQFGSVEAIFSLLAMRDNVAPPTLNLENPSVDTVINLVPKTPVKKEINVALSNSFGFGGTNASLIFRKVA